MTEGGTAAGFATGNAVAALALDVMSETDALFNRIAANGVVLSAANGRLRFKAPRGALTEELRHELEQHRDELLAALSGPSFQRSTLGEPAPILEFYQELWAKNRSGILDVTFTNAPHWLLRVEGDFSLAALDRAVALLCSRHRILRANVIEVPSGPHFTTHGAMAVTRIGFDGTPCAEPQLPAAIRECVWRPFRADETFFRPFVIRVATHAHVVGFVLHHMIGDAWSVALLADELVQAYLRAVDSADVVQQDGDGPLQYLDYIAAMNVWVRGPGLRRRLQYWKRQMRNAPASRLLPDCQVEDRARGIMRAESFALGVEETRGLRQVAKQFGTTLFFVFTAIKAYALYRHLQQQDLVVLSMFHGRDDPRLAPVVGSMQNQIPLRISIEPTMSFATLVRAVQDVCAEAYSQQVPYHYIRAHFAEIGAVERFAELNFHDRGAGPTTHALPAGIRSAVPMAVGEWPISANTPAYFPAHSLIVSASAQIAGVLVYLDCLYAPQSIHEFLRTLNVVVRDVLADPHRALSGHRATQVGAQHDITQHGFMQPREAVPTL